MRPGDLLRQLDRQLLPPLARGLTRLGQGPLRLRLRLLTSVALLCSVAVLVTAVWAADRPPAIDPTLGDVTRVGVVQGESIPGYVAASRGELAALIAAPPAGAAPRPYALVTLAAYLAPDRLPPVLAGVEISEVYARLWRPGSQTQIVRIPALRLPDDVTAGMLEVAERKDQEVRDYQERSAAVVGDSPDAQELRRFYDSGARVASDEAIAYRSGCSCVYAAVVRGEPAALGRVAARAGVRAVDPAPEVRRLDRTVFTPPLPEQEDVVRPPADSSMPPAPTAPGDPTGPVLPPAGSAASDGVPGAPGGALDPSASGAPASGPRPAPSSTAPAPDPVHTPPASPEGGTGTTGPEEPATVPRDGGSPGTPPDGSPGNPENGSSPDSAGPAGDSPAPRLGDAPSGNAPSGNAPSGEP
ncbi:hypothetical protein [Plantactinospora sp. B5E13]|uniref:hypothetical protein n=1 Tax=Plantactinospora sp. B5E13 TaxID=3153758 RepID=UPI00325D18B4